MAFGIDSLNQIKQEISTLSGTISQNESEVNLFSQKSATTADSVKFSEQAKAEADTNLATSQASVKALKSSAEGAEMALASAQAKLQADPDNADLKEVVATKQESLNKIQQQIKEAEGQTESATTVQAKTTEDLRAATEAKTSAESSLSGAQTTLTGNQSKLSDLNTKQNDIEVKMAAEQPATQTGGSVTTTDKSTTNAITTSGEVTRTTTVTENSREFKAQEKENFLNAKAIADEYRDGNSLDVENSLDDNKSSSRVEQRKALATVDYTPELTTYLGKAEVYQDSVNSADNEANAATSIVRSKEDAVNYYFDKVGITDPTVADIYAAEYAVSALQPDIVANAKAAEEYQAKFTEGTATQEERDAAVSMLENGADFEGRAHRDVSQNLVNSSESLLDDTEKSALIDKIKSGATDFSDRELNALTYLQGTTDVQGFPTVPKDMIWELPTEFKSEDQLFQDYAETYVCNFRSNDNYGNTVKLLVDPESDAGKIFMGMSTQYDSALMGSTLVSDGRTSWQDTSKIEGYTSQYSNSNIVWSDLRTIAGEDNMLTAQELVDAGKLDASILSTLENPDQKYEIPNFSKNGLGAVLSAEKLTDGDTSTHSTTLASGIANVIKSTGGYAVTGGNDLQEYSMPSVKAGSMTRAEFCYYVPDAKGNPVLKRVPIDSTNARYESYFENLKKIAEENYQKFKSEGKLQ